MEIVMNQIDKGHINSGKKISIKAAAVYFLLSLYFVCFSDTVWFSFNSNAAMVSFGQISMSTLSILFLMYGLFSKKIKFNISFLYLIIVVLALFASSIYHKEFSGGYISKICLFIMGFSVCFVFDMKKITKYYQIIIDLICISSLVGMLIMIVSPSFISKLPSVTNIGGRKFYLFLLSFLTEGTTIRNYGLFTEPSRFQAYINFSLILTLFDNFKINKKRAILLIITLLTTYSTTGFLAFLVIFVAFIFSNKVHISIVKKAVIVISGIIVIAILLNFTSFFDSSIYKITSGAASESYSVRYNSIFGGLHLIRENLIFGTGIANANSSFINATSNLYDVREITTYTNTFFMSISKFGIIPGLFYLSHFWKTSKYYGKGIIISLFIFLSFFIMLSGISFLESIMFNIIPMFHFTKKEKEGLV